IIRSIRATSGRNRSAASIASPTVAASSKEKSPVSATRISSRSGGSSSQIRMRAGALIASYRQPEDEELAEALAPERRHRERPADVGVETGAADDCELVDHARLDHALRHELA